MQLRSSLRRDFVLGVHVLYCVNVATGDADRLRAVCVESPLAMWKGRYAEFRQVFDAFWEKEVLPHEPRFFEELKAIRSSSNRWRQVPVIRELQAKAKAANLFNLFLPHESGLTQYEYAQVAEVMGRATWFTQVFNCDAPDTGNMETLHLYGNDAQKKQWLEPLLRADIRSAIVMTEPDVASSDATNVATTAVRDGDSYVINGRKWYITGVGNEHCKLLVVVLRTSNEGPRHRRHSIILVPKDAPGVKLVRPMEVMGCDDAPYGHWEMTFDNVRVPVGNRLKEEGEGFAMAQGRLGPGRVHHAMRSIGHAERAMDLMLERVVSRVAFGKPLAKNAVIQHQIAECRLQLEQARQLVLFCARQLDTVGAKKAMQSIAMIKVAAPRAACHVIDVAMQMHGAMGLSQDTILPQLYAGQRSLRVADGPDDVHLMTIGKLELAKYVRRQQAKL